MSGGSTDAQCVQVPNLLFTVSIKSEEFVIESRIQFNKIQPKRHYNCNNNFYESTVSTSTSQSSFEKQFYSYTLGNGITLCLKEVQLSQDKKSMS